MEAAPLNVGTLQGFWGTWTPEVALLSFMGPAEFCHLRPFWRLCSWSSWALGEFFGLCYVYHEVPLMKWSHPAWKTQELSPGSRWFWLNAAQCLTQSVLPVVPVTDWGCCLGRCRSWSKGQQGEQCYCCLWLWIVSKWRVLHSFVHQVYFLVSSTEIPSPKAVLVGCSVTLFPLPVIVSWDYQG